MDEADKGTPPALAETQREHGVRYYPGRYCPREAPCPPGHDKVSKNSRQII